MPHCPPIQPSWQMHVAGSTSQSPWPLQQIFMLQSAPPQPPRHRHPPSMHCPRPEQEFGQKLSHAPPVYPVKHVQVPSGLHFPLLLQPSTHCGVPAAFRTASIGPMSVPSVETSTGGGTSAMPQLAPFHPTAQRHMPSLHVPWAWNMWQSSAQGTSLCSVRFGEAKTSVAFRTVELPSATSA